MVQIMGETRERFKISSFKHLMVKTIECFGPRTKILALSAVHERSTMSPDLPTTSSLRCVDPDNVFKFRMSMPTNPLNENLF
jgi:hypothetical protein